MKVLERTIQLYRKVDNNEPMEEMHKRVMEGLSKIEAQKIVIFQKHQILEQN